MKKLLVAIGSIFALLALYVSTNLNGKKKGKKEIITIEDVDNNDLD